MNVLLTTGTDGTVTVHRENCKKIEDQESLSLDDQIKADPQKLVTAKKATCCKPTPATMQDVEQAGWAALEEASDAEANDDDEDLIGEPAAEDSVDVTEDLIGAVEKKELKVTKRAPKVAAKVAAEKQVDGLAALKKVAKHLGINLGKDPKFPGFGRAFKTAEKQSIYINSKGTADARATDPAQAKEWAALDNVERRAGNYVRISFGNL